MHKRRKRILQKKSKRVLIFECAGLKMQMSQLVKSSAKMERVWLNGTLLPNDSLKGFDFTLSNPLTDIPEFEDSKSRLTYLEREADISFTVKLSDENIENLLQGLAMRRWTEKNDDGTFSHSFIYNTEDYKIFDDKIIE